MKRKTLYVQALAWVLSLMTNSVGAVDVVCFAPYIKAKTFMTWGYNDNTCPPTTSYTVWNLLQCEKESLVTPINEHWASDATKQRQVQWVLENIKK